MPPILSLARRYPLQAFCVLAFGISWGGLLLAVGPSGFPATPETFERLLPLAVVSMLAGPPIAGLLITRWTAGTLGLRTLLAQLRAWRTAPRWWVIALVTAPLLMSGLLLTLSSHAPEYRPGILATPDPMGLLRFGLIVGLAAGFFEELGWTGVALPLLRRRYAVLPAGLILGVIWAAWHLLPAFWFSSRSTAPGATAAFLLDPFLFLVGYRVLMVWIWEQTRSLPVGMAMHGSLTASARILGPLAMSGTMLLLHDLLWAGLVWLAVALIFSAEARVTPSARAI
jgi:membrane protease YdiL (CAAX protease family)